MSDTAAWPAWIVTGISLGVSLFLLGCVIVNAVRDRRRGEDTVPEPQD
jgi:hypothetical protein